MGAGCILCGAVRTADGFDRHGRCRTCAHAFDEGRKLALVEAVGIAQATLNIGCGACSRAQHLIAELQRLAGLRH